MDTDTLWVHIVDALWEIDLALQDKNQGMLWVHHEKDVQWTGREKCDWGERGRDETRESDDAR